MSEQPKKPSRRQRRRSALQRVVSQLKGARSERLKEDYKDLLNRPSNSSIHEWRVVQRFMRLSAHDQERFLLRMAYEAHQRGLITLFDEEEGGGVGTTQAKDGQDSDDDQDATPQPALVGV